METTIYRTQFGVQTRKAKAPVNPGTLSLTLDLVQKFPGISAAEVSEGIGKCLRTAYRALDVLIEKACVCKGVTRTFSTDGRELELRPGYYYEPGTDIKIN